MHATTLTQCGYAAVLLAEHNPIDAIIAKAPVALMQCQVKFHLQEHGIML